MKVVGTEPGPSECFSLRGCEVPVQDGALGGLLRSLAWVLFYCQGVWVGSILSLEPELRKALTLFSGSSLETQDVFGGFLKPSAAYARCNSNEMKSLVTFNYNELYYSGENVDIGKITANSICLLYCLYCWLFSLLSSC